MRSALALSALLLILLPLSSLSEEDDQSTAKPTTTSKPSTTLPPTKETVVSNTANQSIVSAPGDASADKDSEKTPLASSDPGVAPASSQPSTATAPSSTKVNLDITVTTTGGPKDYPGSGQTTSTPTATPTKPQTTSSQNGINDKTLTGTHTVTTNTMTPKEGSQTTLGPSSVVPTPNVTPAGPSLTTPTGTQPLASGPVTLTPPDNSSEGPDKMTTASSSPGTMAGHTGISQGTSASLSTTPLVTLQDQQTSGKMPAITGISTSETPWPGPTVLSSGPVSTTPVGPTGSSTQLAPTSAQGSKVSSFTSTFENGRIRCEPPERLNDKMLILNLTKTSLCQAGSPPDDKLVTLLCRAAKANFNSNQDQCHIRLVPIPEIQAVAIKEISIQTNLLPMDVYESLKDKWDDLKEVGVSNMQLGDQGPPEEAEDRFSMPLIITIVCMASFLLLVAALYGCCHQRLSQRKDQQRLTEELQTVENGYHDNPTLEVMETSSEMQEKKVVNLNGELGDSWIVPLDNLIKDDLDEEEDTHL